MQSVLSECPFAPSASCTVSLIEIMSCNKLQLIINILSYRAYESYGFVETNLQHHYIRLKINSVKFFYCVFLRRMRNDIVQSFHGFLSAFFFEWA